MITLITGLPGNGKSLFALHHVKKRSDKEDRQVYYNGIPELTLDWVQLDEAKDWHTLPAGSIVVIDEAQRIFPRRKLGAPVPEHVSQFETHRHHGFDVYIITQHPSLIDPHLRALVGQHFHVVRQFGLQRAKIYEWPRAADVTKKSDLAEAQPHRWSYPTEVFSWYKSSELHTHKRNIPKKLWLLLLVAVCVPALVYATTHVMSRFVEKPATDSVVDSAPAIGSVPAPLAASSSSVAGPLTREQYMQERQPRLLGFPATAPAYDRITTPVAAPRPAACLTTKTRCACYTQQGTLMPDMPVDICVQIARNGYFDDTLRDSVPVVASVASPAAAPPTSPVAPVPPVAVATAPGAITAPVRNPAVWW
ncbi:zonular occludens toxin domain-containing protein [Chitinimonas lacunae]|uniref:Zonular occludens toxin domain-containing protein n=1 Tax=Chitinimonas lacunae TaxID=1963018 RepID=A0ABV8MLB9_9NEIS